ncbi:MAG: GatB/YqeY domain-containing protein [Candidatus Sungbacteria bacterium]|uniref:GatB/YqeY domain-containing protein n=1 Tax=Candidatus Sungiibacteriota bacterium TaxID=2750080 RepID=A0A932YXK4_9BACT|nr:GatB/YqeY domain-containing protein [Candidatus Sungbacteria bacterium]
MLKTQIDAALQQALKSRDALRLSAFRMLSAALHNREIEKRTKAGAGEDVPLTEEEIIQVIRSEVKKRHDAVEAYERGGRPDAAAKERAEADILSALLPAELSDSELLAFVAEGKVAIGAVSLKEFGKLMGWVMQRVGSRASGDRVSAIIKKELGA